MSLVCHLHAAIEPSVSSDDYDEPVAASERAIEPARQPTSISGVDVTLLQRQRRRVQERTRSRTTFVLCFLRPSLPARCSLSFVRRCAQSLMNCSLWLHEAGWGDTTRLISGWSKCSLPEERSRRERTAQCSGSSGRRKLSAQFCALFLCTRQR